MEDVPLATIAAEFGTPVYAYSKMQLHANWRGFSEEVRERKVQICYAVKANSNLSILREFVSLGAGFDIVSGGELCRVLEAGGSPDKIVFSGVGKSRSEIEQALRVGIGCFNVESEPELERLALIAQKMGLVAPVSLRVNPNVDAGTHPYISTGLKENKFGIAWDDARRVYGNANRMPSIAVRGIDCHIGSQITEIAPFIDALDRILDLADQLQEDGIEIHHLDLGGGLGIQYQDDIPPDAAAFMQALFGRLDLWKPSNLAPTIMFEFGRALVGNAGLLLTKVEYFKPTAAKNFLIVDAAMNDLIRPALYDAYHAVIEVSTSGKQDSRPYVADIVGPVCETGDWLARDRMLFASSGDILAILSAGAYGMAQASNYNTRGRAAEVLVDGDQIKLIRRRETYSDLVANERELTTDPSAGG